MSARILFLDDDPVVQVFRQILCDAKDPWIADFVSLMLPNTPEIAPYAGPPFFSAMRRDAFFINLSRGALVDEDALYSALVSSRIAGAARDVHAMEPRSLGDRFAALDNFVLTPHLAGGAKSGLLDEFAVIARNCHAAFRGEAVRHEVRVPAPSPSSSSSSSSSNGQVPR